MLENSKFHPGGEKELFVEAPGIDPGTSRMLSERSTIWATPPGYFIIVRIGQIYFIWHSTNKEADSSTASLSIQGDGERSLEKSK